MDTYTYIRTCVYIDIHTTVILIGDPHRGIANLSMSRHESPYRPNAAHSSRNAYRLVHPLQNSGTCLHKHR